VQHPTRFRRLALSFPETYEEAPWGHPVFKVGANKMLYQPRDNPWRPVTNCGLFAGKTPWPKQR
jgi:hypothetical protein